MTGGETEGGYARSVLAFSGEYAWAILGAAVLLGIALPFLGLQEGYYMTVLTELMLFAVLALSWDLIGGQTGYPSFGQMAFFGVGAYVTAILVKDFAVAFPAAFAVSGLIAMGVAGIIGLVVLRLRGGYFAIATLGILLVFQQVSRILDITGGSSGKILLETPSATSFYYLYLGLLVAEIVLVYYLTSTRFGLVLNAIRDDEGKATAMGFNTTYYKTAAWMVAALFTGFAGGAYGLFNTFIDPHTAYNLEWNVELIAMALLGGTGTVAGPVIGAFGLRAVVREVESFRLVIDGIVVNAAGWQVIVPTPDWFVFTIAFAGWQLVIIGAVVIVTVVSFPQGFVGSLKERASAMEYYKHGGQAASESPGGDEESDSS